MNSLILQTAARFLLVLMLVFSLWVLFRGHNAPGGGFIGGLIAASAFSLYLIAYGSKKLERWFIIELPIMLGVGLTVLLISGLLAMFRGKVFFSSLWVSLGKYIDLGSPLLFDIGIYLIVIVSVLMIVHALEDFQA